jgi:hypothetical protein
MAFGLARFDLTTITRTLELTEISADPAAPVTLTLRFCGFGSRDWEAWQFARAAAGENEASDRIEANTKALEKLRADGKGKSPEAAELGRQVLRDQVAVNRAFARDVLAGVGLVGWANVDEDGKPMAFAPEVAARFLAELHDAAPDALSRAAAYATTRSNFRADVPIADPGALGKG